MREKKGVKNVNRFFIECIIQSLNRNGTIPSFMYTFHCCLFPNHFQANWNFRYFFFYKFYYHRFQLCVEHKQTCGNKKRTCLDQPSIWHRMLIQCQTIDICKWKISHATVYAFNGVQTVYTQLTFKNSHNMRTNGKCTR